MGHFQQPLLSNRPDHIGMEAGSYPQWRLCWPEPSGEEVGLKPGCTDGEDSIRACRLEEAMCVCGGASGSKSFLQVTSLYHHAIVLPSCFQGTNFLSSS